MDAGAVGVVICELVDECLWALLRHCLATGMWGPDTLWLIWLLVVVGYVVAEFVIVAVSAAAAAVVDV